MVTANLSDTFDYVGYTVYWSGWRDVPNQLIRFGFWVAYGDGLIYYSTTAGRFGTMRHELEVMDLSREKGWPVSPFVHGPVEFGYARLRAWERMAAYLSELPLI